MKQKPKTSKPREWKGWLVCDHGQHDRMIYESKLNAQLIAAEYNTCGSTHKVIQVKITEVKRGK